MSNPARVQRLRLIFFRVIPPGVESNRGAYVANYQRVSTTDGYQKRTRQLCYFADYKSFNRHAETGRCRWDDVPFPRPR